jgi:hypothetical protein
LAKQFAELEKHAKQWVAKRTLQSFGGHQHRESRFPAFYLQNFLRVSVSLG